MSRIPLTSTTDPHTDSTDLSRKGEAPLTSRIVSTYIAAEMRSGRMSHKWRAGCAALGALFSVACVTSQGPASSSTSVNPGQTQSASPASSQDDNNATRPADYQVSDTWKRSLMVRMSPEELARFSASSASTARPGAAILSADDFLKMPYEQRWYGNAVMYEVMVRSFFDSNGDGIGDLNGLTQKLDYLNTGNPSTTTDLKVDALWLMPIFKSPSYHGYDATDYRQIDPVYGTEADFERLIVEAHKRGIRILLDLVLNHTSNMHPWFQKAGRSEEPAERDWYVWGVTDPGWERPWGGGPVWHKRGNQYYYGLFWEGMPDLNFRHPAVQKEMLDIAQYWIDKGADGYRLDAIRYLFEKGKGEQADLPETHAYLQTMAQTLRQRKPEVALVGEVWTDTDTVATYYGKGNELDLCFNFDVSGALIGSVNSHNPQELIEALTRTNRTFSEQRFSAPFLTNHDMPRVATLLNEEPQKLRMAAALLMTLPGTPFLYQGEEVGQIQGPARGDEGKRTPMQWDSSSTAGFSNGKPWNSLSGKQETLSVASEQGKADSLLTWYQTLIRMRRNSAALSSGKLFGVERGTEAQGRVLTLQRASKGELVLGVFNLGTEAAPARSLKLNPEAYTTSGLKGRSLTVRLLGPTAAQFSAPILQGGTAEQPELTIPVLPPGQGLWIQVQ